jgi:hypothetical protein
MVLTVTPEDIANIDSSTTIYGIQIYLLNLFKTASHGISGISSDFYSMDRQFFPSTVLFFFILPLIFFALFEVLRLGYGRIFRKQKKLSDFS